MSKGCDKKITQNSGIEQNNITNYGSTTRIEKTQDIFIQDLMKILPENFDKDELFPRIQLINGLIIRLYLYELELKQLPKSIRYLYKLRILWLGSNQLSTLPKEISYLQNLEDLSLGGNNFETLPEEIGDLNSLKYLNIACNYLKSLPYSIGFLKSLRTLILYKN